MKQNTPEVWNALAADYSRTFEGEIPKDDIIEYTMAIASILSDAQEVAGEAFQDTLANARINAAKVMLADMRQAARLKERSTA